MQAEEKSEGLELGFEFTGSCSSLVQAAVAWMCLTLIWAKSSLFTSSLLLECNATLIVASMYLTLLADQL